MECAGMFVICLCTKFQMPSSK